MGPNIEPMARPATQKAIMPCLNKANSLHELALLITKRLDYYLAPQQSTVKGSEKTDHPKNPGDSPLDEDLDKLFRDLTEVEDVLNSLANRIKDVEPAH